MKRILSAILASVMALTLVACGGGNGGSTTPPAGGSSASSSGSSSASGSSSEAEGWVPTKTIEFVIPFAAGGGNDILVRKMVEIITKNNMCPVDIIPVSKPGGSGVVGYAYLNSMGVGYEYALASNSASFYTQPLTGNSPYTPDTGSFSFVSHMVKDPTIFVSISSLGFQSLQDVVDYAKANPGKLKYAGTGIVSDDAIIMAMLNDIFGIELVYVPYDSAGDMLSALLGGHVQLGVMSPAEAIEHIDVGSLTAQAASADARLDLLPDVPTFVELGVDLAHQQSRAIVMSAGVSDEVLAYYSDLFRRVSETSEWQEFVDSNNMMSAYMDYQEYGEFTKEVQSDYETFLAIIAAAQA